MKETAHKHTHKQQHHVFVFRHCVRSTKNSEKLHNNWTALMQNTEVNYEPEDFLATETFSNWNTPEYWCTETGVDIMEGSGRFLLDQLVQPLLLPQKEEEDLYDQQQQQPPPKVITLDFQILVDDSPRDMDTALALIRGLRQQGRGYENMTNVQLRVRGLEQLTFASSLFNPLREASQNNADDDGAMLSCKDKVASSDINSDGSFFRDRIRNEIQHRLDTVPPPEPGLAATLSKIEQLGGRGILGSIQDVPTWIMGSGEDDELPGAPNYINTTSPFPVVVGYQHESIYLAGPINLVKWMAQMAFYTRAGGVEVPFLWNVTLPELYRLVEWIHWERTILNVENSLAATKGAVMARAILDGLVDGHVHHGVVVASSNSNSNDEENSPPCLDNTVDDNSEEDQVTTTIKVTFIVGHDGDMDSIATALGLRWRLQPPYHTSPANQKGEYVPTPPGSAMHFQWDFDSDNDGSGSAGSGTLSQSFWYPVLIEQFDSNSTDVLRIPKGMRRITTGMLEQVPLVMKPRTSIIAETLLMDMHFSKDGKQMVLPPASSSSSTGIDAIEAQLQATLEQYPDATECYRAFLIGHIKQQEGRGGSSSRNPSCQKGHAGATSSTIPTSYHGGLRDGVSQGALIVLGTALGWIVVALVSYLVGRRILIGDERGRRPTRLAAAHSEVATVEDDDKCNNTTNEKDLELL